MLQDNYEVVNLNSDVGERAAPFISWEKEDTFFCWRLSNCLTFIMIIQCALHEGSDVTVHKGWGNPPALLERNQFPQKSAALWPVHESTSHMS